ncbi:MAG: GNAT family N-acetyltransferase [Anaerolineae bacterium]
MPPFNVITAHQIAQLDPVCWDALNGDQPFSSYRWHQFGEHVLHEDTPCYIVLMRDGQPAARATFWITRREVLPTDMIRWPGVAGAFFRRWPLMPCRAPLTPASSLILPADKSLHPTALETLSETARSIARQHHVSFLFFDYLEAPLTGLRGYGSLDMAEPGTELAIQWADFDSYLSSLKKSAYKDYRRHANRAADLGISMTVLPLNAETVVPDVEQAIRLIQNVDRAHNSPSHPYMRRALEQAHHGTTSFIAARIGDRLVGCGLMLRDGDHAMLSLLGLDYDVEYVYFQLFYAAVRTAIETGVKVLWGGSGAYEYKERFGFQKQHKTTVTFTASNRLVGNVMQTLLSR